MFSMSDVGYINVGGNLIGSFLPLSCFSPRAKRLNDKFRESKNIGDKDINATLKGSWNTKRKKKKETYYRVKFIWILR